MTCLLLRGASSRQYHQGDPRCSCNSADCNCNSIGTAVSPSAVPRIVSVQHIVESTHHRSAARNREKEGQRRLTTCSFKKQILLDVGEIFHDPWDVITFTNIKL